MKITALVPAVEHTAAFELYFLGRITQTAGCYCLTNAAGDILYVGQAASLRQRLKQHFESEKRQAVTVFGRISRVYWLVAERKCLSALERGWLERIRLYDGVLPPLNRVSAPI